MTEPIAEPEDHVLDGNAAAGMLAAAFGVEMTAVPGACAHCGTISVLATLRAYMRAPGVVLRIVETPNATLVDASGAAWLRFERG